MGNTGANHRLSQVKSLLQDIVKGFYRYRRTAATHVLVIMISTETRTKKPYALPIQCLPYRGLTDSEIRVLLNSVIKEMALLGMKVAGRHTFPCIYNNMIIIYRFRPVYQWRVEYLTVQREYKTPFSAPCQD